MMRRTVFLAITIVMVLSAFLPVSSASATTERIPVSGSEVCTEIAPGRSWMDGSVLQVRGSVFDCTMAGDEYLTGTETVVVNFNLDLATGMGTLWGTFRSDLAAFDGGFEGAWNGHWLTFPRWSGKAVGRGWGELDGSQVRLDLYVAAPGSLSGFVFSPGA